MHFFRVAFRWIFYLFFSLLYTLSRDIGVKQQYVGLCYRMFPFSYRLYEIHVVIFRTNCSTDHQCWQDALTYHSSELVHQLFSFGSLAVYVDTFQRNHESEVCHMHRTLTYFSLLFLQVSSANSNGNSSEHIALIEKALEDHLLNEANATNIPSNLFEQTKTLLFGFVRNKQLSSCHVDIAFRFSVRI